MLADTPQIIQEEWIVDDLEDTEHAQDIDALHPNHRRDLAFASGNRIEVRCCRFDELSVNGLKRNTVLRF